ncbi:MAG: DUF5610 domain-containing protein [Marinobacter sp.]|nr:DUF5610 domain-containing protein [Marinobacter sp.]
MTIPIQGAKPSMPSAPTKPDVPGSRKADAPGQAVRAQTPAMIQKAVGAGGVRSAADGIAILRQKLEEKMASFGVTFATRLDPNFEPPTAEEVANRILGFVENRLRLEQAEGADPARLEKLLGQARQGIEAGYGEAREIIGALGMMTEKLAAEINDGFERVQAGLARLAEMFLGTPAADDSGAE